MIETPAPLGEGGIFPSGPALNIPKNRAAGPTPAPGTPLPGDRFTRQTQAAEHSASTAPEGGAPTEKAEFSFFDFLDIVNPLHHIPVVGNIYRAITGDEIKAPARIFGGGIFGGIAGAISGLVNAVVSEVTGRDIGAHLLALFGVGGKQPADESTVAATATDTVPAVATNPTAPPAPMLAMAPAPAGGTEPAETGTTVDALPLADASMIRALHHYQQISRGEREPAGNDAALTGAGERFSIYQ